MTIAASAFFTLVPGDLCASFFLYRCHTFPSNFWATSIRGSFQKVKDSLQTAIPQMHKNQYRIVSKEQSL